MPVPQSPLMAGRQLSPHSPSLGIRLGAYSHRRANVGKQKRLWQGCILFHTSENSFIDPQRGHLWLEKDAEFQIICYPLTKSNYDSEKDGTAC